MRVHDTFVAMEAKDIRPVTDENRVDAVTAPTPLYDPSFTYEYVEDDDQPAVTMTQFAAKQFTKWLSKLVGRQYRLPTEAEWEWACRGGTDTAYSWGGVSDDFDDYAWCAENAEDGPAKVGLKKPNPLGLHDMHGNVAEWTVDGYLEDGYSIFKGKSLRAVDAIKSVETSDYRVVRGGSWESFPEDIRSASRLFSIDEDWKIEDPNFPKSPYWFTDDPTRGIGMRLFRSYKPLSTDNIKKFWEIDSEDTQFGVDARISEQKAIYGLVDPSLPDAKAALK